MMGSLGLGVFSTILIRSRSITVVHLALKKAHEYHLEVTKACDATSDWRHFQHHELHHMIFAAQRFQFL